MAFVTGENPNYDWGISSDTQPLLETGVRVKVHAALVALLFPRQHH